MAWFQIYHWLERPSYRIITAKEGLRPFQRAWIWTVRETPGSKATGLTMEMLSSLGKDYSIIQLPEDGTVKVTPSVVSTKTFQVYLIGFLQIVQLGKTYDSLSRESGS